MSKQRRRTDCIASSPLFNKCFLSFPYLKTRIFCCHPRTNPLLQVCFLFCFLIQSDAICHRIFIKFTHILPFFSDDSLMKKENFFVKTLFKWKSQKVFTFHTIQKFQILSKKSGLSSFYGLGWAAFQKSFI